MKYKLISKNNVVTFKMRTGKDLVRSHMGLHYALSIVAKSKNIVELDGEILVDDMYFFPVKNTKKKKEESRKPEITSQPWQPRSGR